MRESLPILLMLVEQDFLKYYNSAHKVSLDSLDDLARYATGEIVLEWCDAFAGASPSEGMNKEDFLTLCRDGLVRDYAPLRERFSQAIHQLYDQRFGDSNIIAAENELFDTLDSLTTALLVRAWEEISFLQSGMPPYSYINPSAVLIN